MQVMCMLGVGNNKVLVHQKWETEMRWAVDF